METGQVSNFSEVIQESIGILHLLAILVKFPPPKMCLSLVEYKGSIFGPVV